MQSNQKVIGCEGRTYVIRKAWIAIDHVIDLKEGVNIHVRMIIVVVCSMVASYVPVNPVPKPSAYISSG